MRKTFQIHLRIELDVIEQLKAQAQQCNISLAELCRQKLKESPRLVKIENMLDQIHKKIIK